MNEIFLFLILFLQITNQLTDEEFEIKKNHVQKENYDAVINKCNESAESKKACSGIDPGINSTADGLVDGVAKMYSMLGMFTMMSGASGKAASSATQTTSNGSSSENNIDYCSFIPMATEAISTATQQSDQATITAMNSANQNNPAQNTQLDKQVVTLSQAAQSLEARGKTSLIQSVGFMSSATCYLKDLLNNSPNKLLTLVKVGAGYGLGSYYIAKNQKTKEQREKVLKIIEELRGVKGKCNPITETSCYCAMDSTKDDPKYCKPPEYAKRLSNKQLTPISCVDNRLQSDPSCRCNLTDSCVNKTFDDFAKIDIGGALLDKNKPLGQIFSGQLDQNNALNATKSQLAAIRNMLNAQDPFAGTPTPQNKDQQKMAQNLAQQLNLPPGFSNKLATLPLDSSALDLKNKLGNDSDLFNGNYLNTLNNNGSTNTNKSLGSNSSQYYGGGTSKRGSKVNNQTDSLEMPSFGGNSNTSPREGVADQSQLMEFNAKNVSQAQFNASLHTENQNIFELISSKYQKATWSTFLESSFSTSQ